MTLFALFDFVTSNLLMPLGGIVLCLFVGWAWGFERLKQALSNEGTLKNEGLLKALFFVLRYVSPSLILVVMLKGLSVI